jgi:hypothetical protein
MPRLTEGRFEVDLDYIEWVNESMTDEGDIPPSVVKYLTVIAAS